MKKMEEKKKKVKLILEKNEIRKVKIKVMQR